MYQRATLRGSSGVPISVQNTRLLSIATDLAASRSWACRTA